MTRKPNVTTRWTSSDMNCNSKNVCPGVHDLDDRPEVHYVIAARMATDTEVRIWEGLNRALRPGEVLGAVPAAMSADGYMPIAPVEDATDYAAMAPLMGPGEIVGTIPAGSWTLQEVPG
jgi:hypothetical protein